MDVEGNTFRGLLPSILRAISRAHFVSFDLELSGIPVRQTGQPKLSGTGDDGKQTLQERYQEIKKAAERYQILQFGMTCVEEDKERGAYVLRPYNFFLNPLTDKKLDVERDFTYQSGAVGFLLGFGFRMDAPFSEGVPYFSREEERRARAVAARKRDMSDITDIFIKDGDIESRGFIEGVRHEIRPGGYINIAPTTHFSANNTRGLNGFQKRLVHQLVRAEFPDVVSLSKTDFIQLIPYDKVREDAQTRKKEMWFEQNLTSQIGLRWIAEAMCPHVDGVLPLDYRAPHASGNLAALRGCNHQAPRGRIMDPDDNRMADRAFDRLVAELRQKRTVLVGHNVFLDLVYFYTCFFGPLPDLVEDFQQIIGYLFPMVFDTKYLADKINDNSASYNSSLEDLDRELSDLLLPIIEIAPGHEKYASDSPMHEAGFDSFLTAKVLIRLATQIGAETTEEGEEEEEYLTPSEDGGVSLGEGAPSQVRAPTLSSHTMMPHGESSFWRQYGNRLRVNGTVEEVCNIG